MIVNKSDLEPTGVITVDLTGPQGNVFYLLGLARQLSIVHGIDPDDISNEMRSSDYENAVQVLEREFGDHILLIR